MSAHVTHRIGGLVRDLVRVSAEAPTRLAVTVETVARHGNELAVRFATESAGAHGKLYPKAFRVTKASPLTWEYGPSRAYGQQGGMSFEHGSRKQPPHLDMAQSTDVVGPELGHRVETDVDELMKILGHG